MDEDVVRVPTAPGLRGFAPEPPAASQPEALVPSRGSWRERLAKRVARAIYGDRTILVASAADLPKSYPELDDESLGRFTRWMLLATERAHVKKAASDGLPLSAIMAQHGALGLCGYAQEANAGTLEMTLAGVTLRGKPAGNWRILIERQTEEPAMSPEPVEIEKDEAGNITKLTVHWVNGRPAPAQVDRNPEGGDSEAAPSRSDESAVGGNADAPETLPHTTKGI